MALASTAILSRFPGFPSLSFFYPSLQKFFSSANFLPPSSTPLQSPRTTCTFSSTSSYFALDVQRASIDSNFPTVSDSEEAVIFREEEEEENEPLPEQQQATESASAPLPSLSTPNLTIKEKKELSSYAHSLGKNLVIQQVGKSGVTLTVAAAMADILEANELLKLKVHRSCPGELIDVIQQLENATGSAAVSQIGRTVILYRPSLTKMKKIDSHRSKKLQQMKHAKSVTVLKGFKRRQKKKEPSVDL